MIAIDPVGPLPRRVRRVAVVAVASAALVVAAGCGGSDDPGPGDTVRTYYRALLAGDGARACTLLTPELERDVSSSPGARKAGNTCRDIMTLASGLNPDRAGDDLAGLEIDVQQNGDTARARLANPLTNQRETLNLERQDGAWKIATLVLRPRR